MAFLRSLTARLVADRQDRNALALALNPIVGALAGVAFWLLVARVAGLSTAEVGVGFAVISVGTVLGILGKGGLDTALLRWGPTASREGTARLARMAMLAGVCVAATLGTAGLAAALLGWGSLTPGHWLLATTIGALLVVTWLQDARFLAEGDARLGLARNLVFSAARILLPLPLVLLAAPEPVAAAWALGLAASALAAWALERRLPQRAGGRVTRRDFLRSSLRNISGTAAEFLPGLLLAPIVLATLGATEAGRFGMAWTAASVLYFAAAALSRSALAELVRTTTDRAAVVRRALRHHVLLVIPALLTAALAKPILAVFGASYAVAWPTLAILALGLVVVAPAYLHLAVLRAEERPIPLILMPATLVVALLVLTPPAALAWGLPGVAAAWLVANVPMATYGTFRIARLTKEVTHAHPIHRPALVAAAVLPGTSASPGSPAEPRALRGGPHLE